MALRRRDDGRESQRKGVKTYETSIQATSRDFVKWRSLRDSNPQHALRHSYATYRLAQTQDAAKTALELGNSPTMLFRNYRQLADETQASGWFAIAPTQLANVVQMKGAA